MHKSIPAAAAVILELVYRTETGVTAPQCYNVLYAHAEKHEPYSKKPITYWTLDEIEADGPRRTKLYGSSAAGAAQFMRDTLDKPGTLLDIEGEMGLTGKEIFSPDMQDLMAYHLLKRRGFLKFMNGEISAMTFGNNLAKEWASFPVLCALNGAHKKLVRGETYYAGDKLNKVLLKPAAVEKVLAQALALGLPVPAPVEIPVAPVPHPSPAPKSDQGWAIGDIIKAIFAFFASLIKRKKVSN